MSVVFLTISIDRSIYRVLFGRPRLGSRSRLGTRLVFLLFSRINSKIPKTFDFVSGSKQLSISSFRTRSISEVFHFAWNRASGYRGARVWSVFWSSGSQNEKYSSISKKISVSYNISSIFFQKKSISLSRMQPIVTGCHRDIMTPMISDLVLF